MYRRPLAVGLLVVLTLVIQSAVLPRLGAPVRPDLPLVLCVLAGLAGGARGGLAAGVAVGLLQDLLAGRFLGLFLALKAVLGGLAGLASEQLQRDRHAVPAVACLLATIIQRAGLLAALRFAGGGVTASPWHWGFWAEAAVNAALGALLYSPVARLQGRLKLLSAQG